MKNKRNVIVFIRHGESDYNEKGIIQGQTDASSLTATGVAQAIKAGEWLNDLGDLKIDSIITSPLRRSYETAKKVAERLCLSSKSIKCDNRLLEIDFGTWTGKKRMDIRTQQQQLYWTWRSRPDEFYLDGRHPVRELYSRLEPLAAELATPFHNNSIKVIVGHRGSISALIILLLKLPKTHHHFLQIDRGSVTVLVEKAKSDSVRLEYELLCANERPNADSRYPVDFKTEERTRSSGEVFLIRNGQTQFNIDRKFQGVKDESLSKLGVESIATLAKSFSPNSNGSDHCYAQVISSPLKRAQESARILASAFEDIPVSEDDRLQEISYGDWEGSPEEEVQRRAPFEYEQWKTNPEKVTSPGGESLNDAFKRCADVCEYYEWLIDSYGGGIISVAHDIINRLLICNMLSLPVKYMWSFHQSNASVSVLAVKKNLDGKLRTLNHSHYSLLLRLDDVWP